MSFNSLFTGNATHPVTLATSRYGWNTLTKSPREILELGGPGEADKLTLIYEGLATFDYDWAAETDYQIGAEPAGITTPGDWYVSRPQAPEYVGSCWMRLPIVCEGLYAAKPNKVRWFSTERIVTATDRKTRVSVEMDAVINGSQPDFSAVYGNATLSPEPDMSFMAAAPYYSSYDWHLVDLKGAALCGRDDLWLATYRYDFTYVIYLTFP